MRRPSTDYPARPCCSIVAGPGNLLVWTPPCRRPHDGADRAGRGAVTLRRYRAFHRLSMAAGPSGAGSSKGLRCLRKPTAAARDLRSPTRALLFHSQGRPGKLEVVATKPMATQRDLSLAYSPGVAVPVLAIAEAEDRAYDYTTKGNFVAVITNGTAILGSGNRGALAAKPVMEGKAVLFKRFADIDLIDLEVSSEDPDEIVNCVKLLGKSWAVSTSRTSAPRNASSSSSGCGASRHSGIPRRPARHRDHRGGGLDQRTRSHRARHQDDQARVQRRRRRRHRLSRASRRSASPPTTSFSATPRAWSIRAAPRA